VFLVPFYYILFDFYFRRRKGEYEKIDTKVAMVKAKLIMDSIMVLEDQENARKVREKPDLATIFP